MGSRTKEMIKTNYTKHTSCFAVNMQNLQMIKHRTGKIQRER